MKSQLLLNVAPIVFKDAEIKLGILDWESDEQLRVLRATYSHSHVFRRNGNLIISVPVTSNATLIGRSPNSASPSRLRNDLALSGTLVSHALINYFHKIGRRVLSYQPIKFIAEDSASNLMAQALQDRFDCPEWISVKPLFEANVRVFHLDRQEPFLGLALNVRTTRIVTWTCEDFIEDGFNLVGLYVGRRMPSQDCRMAPRFELLGRVASVKAGRLYLEDSRSGLESIPAKETVLELRNDAFDRCFRHAFKGDQGEQARTALDRFLGGFQSGPERLARLRRVISHISNQQLEMIPGTAFAFQALLSERGRQFPSVQTAPGAVYVFDPSGSPTATWHDGGLDRYGPYTGRVFTPNHPRVCVICQRSKKGRVEQFLRKFLNGIRHVGEGRAPFAKGLIRKYELENVSVDFFPTDDDTASSYRKAVRQAIELHGPQGPKWNLALVQIDERFHNLKGKDNPYLVTKAGFLQHQIPIQEFTIETVDIPNKRLAYVLNNMALASYAKLGGIPWLIKADPAIAHELVIGLGSARISDGRLGEQEQVVGITTVFTGDGNYCVSNISKVVPIAEYKDELLSVLRAAVHQIRKEMNWQRREPVRLIFHVFKPLKDIETEAVKNLMSELDEYDCDYAFLHIAEDHPYIVFDESQLGVRDFESGQIKGACAPNRGTFFRLSKREVLISLVGAKEVKRSQDGIPHPLLLKLHRNSTFEDTTYLARQVYTFSCHSWRSFFPSPIPVTILYSELIARLLGQLSTLPNWDPDIMLGRVGRTRWFL